MGNAVIRTKAEARALARRRWGTTRLDGLVRELRDRSDELVPRQVADLQDVLVMVAGRISQEGER